MAYQAGSPGARLEMLQRKRTVAVMLSHFSCTAAIVARTAHVMTIASGVAKAICRS